MWRRFSQLRSGNVNDSGNDHESKHDRDHWRDLHRCVLPISTPKRSYMERRCRVSYRENPSKQPRKHIYAILFPPSPAPCSEDPMAFTSANVFAGAFSFIILILLVFRYRYKLRRRPPPGPPGLPMVGNMHDIPAPHESPWLKYHDWCQEYSEHPLKLALAFHSC